MTQEDVEIPARPPRKRLAMAKAPALWLQLWANDQALSPIDRLNAQSEIDRRKVLTSEKVMGVVVDLTGMSPPQWEALVEAVDKESPTGYMMLASTFGNLRKAARKWPWTVAGSYHEIVLQTQLIYCFARPGRPEGVVYDAMRYAKHRKVPVHLILPTGEESPLTKG